jgi:DNA-binding NtrC family response regulator
MKDRGILIIGDDLLFSKSIKEKIGSSSNHKIEIFNNHQEAINEVSNTTSIVILNAVGIDYSTNDILISIKNANPETLVLIISDDKSPNTVVSLLKNGAYDYIIKDENTPNKIAIIIREIIDHKKLETDYSKYKNVIIDKYNFNKLIGESQEIQKVYDTIKKILGTNINVSLHGEPGTGKEMIAKVIHYNSDRKLMPFISIDLRAIKYETRDIELLGVDKSTRDDKNNQIGFLERANGGTLFIEGFEDINERFQFYLQKILQNKEIIRVGGIESIPLDIRIITSYNHSLSELVKHKMVKELQYFRTMGVPIEIPPLRQRGNDIIILSKKFINNFTNSNNMDAVTLNLDAQDKLINHAYTGNVQELKAVIELATVMCNDNAITENDIKFNSTKKISDFLLDEKTLKDYTRGIIKHFLVKYDNNVLLVAEKLDVGKSTIYRMLKNNEI